jgi:RimJ/RimL family protein N-acetyltransferase
MAFPVVLRSLAMADAPRVQLLAGEHAVAETTAVIPHPYPDGAAQVWIAEQERAWSTGKEYTYAIAAGEEPTLVGVVALRPAPTEQENLGYWIGLPYWGRGYATAAAGAVITLAFSLLDIELVTASHLARNPASGRVMEKCGMRLVRTGLREHRGTAESICVRAITRAAWERQAALDV